MYTRKEYESYFGKVSDADWKNIQKSITTQWIELKESVSGRSYKMSRYNVVSYLIGRNGVVTEKDWDMINRLYNEDIVTY